MIFTKDEFVNRLKTIDDVLRNRHVGILPIVLGYVDDDGKYGCKEVKQEIEHFNFIEAKVVDKNKFDKTIKVYKDKVSNMFNVDVKDLISTIKEFPVLYTNDYHRGLIMIALDTEGSEYLTKIEEYEKERYDRLREMTVRTYANGVEEVKYEDVLNIHGSFLKGKDAYDTTNDSISKAELMDSIQHTQEQVHLTGNAGFRPDPIEQAHHLKDDAAMYSQPTSIDQHIDHLLNQRRDHKAEYAKQDTITKAEWLDRQQQQLYKNRDAHYSMSDALYHQQLLQQQQQQTYRQAYPNNSANRSVMHADKTQKEYLASIDEKLGKLIELNLPKESKTNTKLEQEIFNLIKGLITGKLDDIISPKMDDIEIDKLISEHITELM